MFFFFYVFFFFFFFNDTATTEIYTLSLHDALPIWYRNLFLDATKDQVCGEASTCYSRWPHFGDVAGQIFRYMPEVKLIYIMRHPVDRAYSHYRHLMEERALLTSKPIVSFEQALEEHREIVDTSLYLIQIQQYLQYFSREQLLFLTFDELTRQPVQLMATLCQFLGVDGLDGKDELPLVANPSGSRTMRRKMKVLTSRLRDAPILSTVIDMLPTRTRRAVKSRLIASRLTSLLMRSNVAKLQRQLSTLDGPTRDHLLARFREPTLELQAFLGRNLAGWFN